MAYEQKPDTGSLFRNDRKETESHPDHRGSAMIGGVEYWVSAWINTTGEGKKYFGMKYQAKDAQAPPRAEQGQTDEPDLDDSIPF